MDNFISMDNYARLNNLENVIVELQNKLEDLTKVVSALKIDENTHIRSNATIPPGIATKVAYDSNGLIIRGSKLESSDIPKLDINHITNLKETLSSMISSEELKKFEVMIQNTVARRSDKVFGTGIKVNYDANGFIIDSIPVEESDIPTLSIDKIDGLKERLELIEANHPATVSIQPDVEKIKAGTFTKISVDSTGKVIQGTKLTSDDIPNELITKINLIESSVANSATQKSVDGIAKDVSKKLNANTKIKAGTFTKVNVDEKGLVTKGEELTIRDLPELQISDIAMLETTLRSKANQSDIIELNNTIASVLSLAEKIPSINDLRNELKMKANDSDMKSVINEITSLKSFMNIIDTKIPNEMILDQLNYIRGELSALSGRIDKIEEKLEY